MSNRDILINNLNTLQLHSIINSLSDIDILNKYTDKDYQFLNELFSKEVEYRFARSLNYRLKISKFPVIRILKDTEQAKLIKNINITDIVNQCRNILLVGGTGSGKTHLSLAIGYDLILNGYKVIYYKLHELANLLLKNKSYNNHLKFINKISSFNMIIIDEFGYIPIDNQASYLLYELFTKLYFNNTVLINTHLRFEEWGCLFGIEKTTKVIIDRITHNCQIIETGNTSFRHQ